MPVCLHMPEMQLHPPGIRLHKVFVFILVTLVTPGAGNIPLYRIVKDKTAPGSISSIKDPFESVDHTPIPATTFKEIRELQEVTSVFENITIVEHCSKADCRNDNDDTPQEYTYSHIANIYSHLRAIHAAKASGHEYAVIMESDVELAHATLGQFEMGLQVLLSNAPDGWRIIQLVSLHQHLLRQMWSIRDLFIPWLPHSYSSAGYVINRAGMEELLLQYGAGRLGESLLFRVPRSGVPAFFLLFNSTQTFLATRPLFVLPKPTGGPSGTSRATGVREAAAVNEVHATLREVIRPVVPPLPYRSGLKILGCQVVTGSPSMNGPNMLATLGVFSKNMHMFAKVGWMYHIQAKGSVHEWEELVAKVKRVPGIHVDIDIIQQTGFINKWFRYNKTAHMISGYDVVLLMDSDIDVRAFAITEFFVRWQTLFSTIPIITGVPRYTATTRYRSPPPESFVTSTWQFWLSRVRGDMLGVPTDFVEQFFCLVHGPFLRWFLNRVMTDETVEKFQEHQSAWGPDAIWCGAASDYAPSNISCAMVPLGVGHLDTKTITREVGYKERSGGMLTYLEEVHPKWMTASKRFRRVFAKKKYYSRPRPPLPTEFNNFRVLPEYRMLKVSVVVLTYNRPEFLRFTIDRIFESDYPIHEVIVIEDSVESHKKVVQGFPQVRYHHLTLRSWGLRGPMTTGEKRNYGCRVATGEVIVHWDDTDYYSPSRIRTQIGPIISKLADVTLLDLRRLVLLPYAGVYEFEAGLWYYNSLVYRRAVWNSRRTVFTKMNDSVGVIFVWTVLQQCFSVSPMATGESSLLRLWNELPASIKMNNHTSLNQERVSSATRWIPPLQLKGLIRSAAKYVEGSSVGAQTNYVESLQNTISMNVSLFKVSMKWRRYCTASKTTSTPKNKLGVET